MAQNTDPECTPDAPNKVKAGVIDPLSALKFLKGTPIGKALLVVLGAGAVVITLRTWLDPAAAVFGIAALLGAGMMVVLLQWLYDRMSQGHSRLARALEKPVLFLVWAVTVLFVCVLVGGLIAMAMRYLADPVPDTGKVPTAIGKLITGSDKSEQAEDYIRDVEADILRLGRVMPITGDGRAMRNRVLDTLQHAFLQGDDGLLKLQRFKLAPGSKKYRGQSNKLSLDEGAFSAESWAFVLTNKNQDISRLKLECKPNEDEAYWDVSRVEVGADFYFVAFYPGVRMLTHYSRDFAGVEVSDLAGEVREATVLLGGRFNQIGVHRVFAISPAGRLTPYDPELLRQVSAPRDRVRAAFGSFFEVLAKRSDPALARVKNTWNQAVADASQWTGVTIENLQADVGLIFEQQPG